MDPGARRADCLPGASNGGMLGGAVKIGHPSRRTIVTHPERSRRVPPLLAVALLVVACGGGDESQEAREKQMEDYAARYGVNADVELQGEGADEKAVLKVNQPGMNARVGNDIGVPDDFPDDVAVYSGLTILSASKLPNAYMLTAQATDEPDAIVDFFRREMKAKGWTEQPASSVPPFAA